MQTSEQVVGQIGRMIGSSARMLELFEFARKSSQVRYPVLIQGESGTGKELVARMIHETGPAREMPFQIIDCRLWSNSTEPESFDRILTEAAPGGTAFFREIGRLPTALQPSLASRLKETETGPGWKVGASSSWCRIIAATSINLFEAMASASFCQDLYYALNVLQIRIPPLRERKEDICILAEDICRQLSEVHNSKLRIPPLVLTSEDHDRLLSYEWPGNVRELENCLRRAIVFGSLSAVSLGNDVPGMTSSAKREIPPGEHPIALGELERKAIEEAIALAHGDKLLAARWLGIGKTTLYRKLKKYQKSPRRN